MKSWSSGNRTHSTTRRILAAEDAMEYFFEEERGGFDYNFDVIDAMVDSINDAEGDAEFQRLMDEFLDFEAPIECVDCGADISRRPHYYSCVGSFHGEQ